MEPLVWAILLLVLGVVLIILELFVPSGGVISVLAGVCLVGSIGIGFSISVFTGLAMVLACMVLVPASVLVGFKIWPYTPMGKGILNQYAQENEMRPLDPRKELQGRVGRTKSKMMPSGAVILDGKTYNAVTVGMPLEEGVLIQVFEVTGNSIVVRPYHGPIDPEVAGEQQVLEQSLDSLGLDAIDDPLE